MKDKSLKIGIIGILVLMLVVAYIPMHVAIYTCITMAVIIYILIGGN